MNDYPFETIWINGRVLSIRQILSRAEIPINEFERTIFSFIEDWLNGMDSFIQHTSGSTGPPKAIVITRRQMTESARLSAQTLDLRRGDAALCCLNASNIAGKMMLARSFTTGMRIICVTPSSNPFREIPADMPIDFIALVPAQIHDIVRSDSASHLSRVRVTIIGGANVEAQTLNMLQPMGGNFYATYGMTETMSHIALRLLNGPNASPHYTTLPGITVKVDARNCLVVQWSNLPHEMITNDLVELISANSFKWIGRWDNIINTGGIKVIPELLEEKIAAVFRTLNLSQKFFIGSLPDAKFGNRITLLIEGSIGSRNLTSLATALRESLPGHEVPKKIIDRITFIRTANGKLNRTSTVKLVAKDS